MTSTKKIMTQRRQKKKQERAPSTLTSMICILAALLLTTRAQSCGTPAFIAVDTLPTSWQIAWDIGADTYYDLVANPLTVTVEGADYVEIPTSCFSFKWSIVRSNVDLFSPCVYFDNDYWPTKIIVANLDSTVPSSSYGFYIQI